MPIVLPRLLQTILPLVYGYLTPWDVANHLLVLMLIPLVIGVLVKSNLPETASEYQPVMEKASSLTFIILLAVVLGWDFFLAPRSILALVLFFIASLAIGLVTSWVDAALGRADSGAFRALTLGTA
jgi:predicted Na+-dependent transporter